MLDLDQRVQEAANGGLPCFDSAEAVEMLSATFRQIPSQPDIPATVTEVLDRPAAVPIDDRTHAHVRNLGEVPIQAEFPSSLSVTRGSAARHADTRPDAHAPPWLVAMAPSFYKDIGNIDRKLQGRILEAIADLSKHVLQPQGDTIKPLSGNYRNCWRYRIGDYRLIFMPDLLHASLTLLAFASRGSIYEN